MTTIETKYIAEARPLTHSRKATKLLGFDEETKALEPIYKAALEKRKESFAIKVKDSNRCVIL